MSQMITKHLALRTKHFPIIISMLLVVAHLLPWASHATAALTLSANDLAFFTHFTPGAGIFRNEWFYLPVWVSAILLTMSTLAQGKVGRLIGLLGSCAIAALALPRYQFLIGLRDAIRQQGLRSGLAGFEFGLQLGVTLALIFLLVLWVAVDAIKEAGELRRGKDAQPNLFSVRLYSFWVKNPFISSTKLAFLLELICLMACIVPALGLLSVQSAIETLYQSNITLGSGWWLHLIAIFGLALRVGAKIRAAFRS